MPHRLSSGVALIESRPLGRVAFFADPVCGGTAIARARIAADTSVRQAGVPAKAERFVFPRLGFFVAFAAKICERRRVHWTGHCVLLSDWRRSRATSASASARVIRKYWRRGELYIWPRKRSQTASMLEWFFIRNPLFGRWGRCRTAIRLVTIYPFYACCSPL